MRHIMREWEDEAGHVIDEEAAMAEAEAAHDMMVEEALIASIE